MKRRRLTDWHRSRIIAAYERTGRVSEAAKAAGVSRSSAYRVLDRVGVYRSAVPVFPSNLERRAVEMYRGGLSCRGVVAALSREMDPAPSQQWVYQRVEAAGELRSKSESAQRRPMRRRYLRRSGGSGMPDYYRGE
jgi:transposase